MISSTDFYKNVIYGMVSYVAYNKLETLVEISVIRVPLEIGLGQMTTK